MRTNHTWFLVSAALLSGAAGAAAAQPATFGELFADPLFVPVGIRPYDVKAADLNGDGRPDIVVADRGPADADPRTNGDVRVIFNNGAAGFSEGPILNPVDLVEPVSLALDDLNGDGRPDLVVANGGANNIVVFLGSVDGGFVQTPFGTFPTNLSVAAAASLDLGLVDGDTQMDAVVANFSAGGALASFFKGVGDGAFLPAVNIPGGTDHRFIRLADLDGFGDGVTDVVQVSSAPGASVRVRPGNGDGTFTSPNEGLLNVPGSSEINESVAVGDVNNDNKLDVIAVTAAFDPDGLDFGVDPVAPGVLTFFRNVGTVFAEPLFFADGVIIPVGEFPYSIAMGDLDGDGDEDIAVTHRNSDMVDVSVLLNNGAGGFGEPMEFLFESGVGLSPRSVQLVDLDNDGDLDLLTTRKPDFDTPGVGGELVIFLNLTATASADLNGDGCVNGADMATLLAVWGTDGGATGADLNGDGVVNGADLAILLANWHDPCSGQEMPQSVMGDPVADGAADDALLIDEDGAPAQAVQSPPLPWIIAELGFTSVQDYIDWIGLLSEEALFDHIVDLIEMLLAN